MRCIRLALFVALLCLATGCSSNKGKIEGTKWSSTATPVKGQMIPAGFMRLEFTTDGKLVYSAGPITMTGTYRLGAGSTVVLELDKELAGRKTHAEKVVISGSTLTMTDSDGTSLTFNKVN